MSTKAEARTVAGFYSITGTVWIAPHVPAWASISVGMLFLALGAFVNWGASRWASDAGKDAA